MLSHFSLPFLLSHSSAPPSFLTYCPPFSLSSVHYFPSSFLPSTLLPLLSSFHPSVYSLIYPFIHPSFLPFQPFLLPFLPPSSLLLSLPPSSSLFPSHPSLQTSHLSSTPVFIPTLSPPPLPSTHTHPGTSFPPPPRRHRYPDNRPERREGEGGVLSNATLPSPARPPR